ncbi:MULTISPECIES: histidine phosphatase family protein [Bacillus]|uniref:histidine phosphatase family protein n=1 Tax=Bacillus TaxID=1386 RepID=UPI0002E9EFC4|nr:MULTISPECIES: histidine phosphatase family protein [Bacillus]
MIKLGIIRHGSTDWNIEGRAQGRANIPLNKAGVDDAYQLASRLKDEKWDLVYSSDLLRARQTAEIIVGKLDHIPIILDDRLREIDGGLIEGTTEKERIKKWGNKWREMNLEIESPHLVEARAVYFINDVIEKQNNRSILIVSHGGLIKYLLQNLVPNLEIAPSFGNTSITKLSKSNQQWKCDLLNCTAHLR